MPRRKRAPADVEADLATFMGPPSASPATDMPTDAAGTRPVMAPLQANTRGEQDRALRPRAIAEFTGQSRVLRNLGIAIAAARGRHEPLDHALLSGPPGLGKTTLAAILAAEMGVELRETAASLIEKPGDLAAILSSLLPGQILFIDEIHALKRQVEEYLYSAMEDYRISVTTGEGIGASTLSIPLSPFTLVGATTREGLLSAPFRSRFGIRERLDLYSVSELTTILQRSAALLGLTATDEGLHEIAVRSRGTARIANAYLRRIRDLAEVQYQGKISGAVAQEGMGMLGVDQAGLCELDRRLLACLALQGRPVGLKTLAVTLDEDELTIEDTYEPWLIQSGLISKTPAGRVLLPAGLAHCYAHGIVTREQMARPLQPEDLQAPRRS